MNTYIVDVFAEAPLAGNQLAVVLDAAALDSTSMQAIAREFNFSETTFVTASDNKHARVRIFTPSHELPFAGHPTLGTAWVLNQGKPQKSITLQMGLGEDLAEVIVEFDAQTDICWLESPNVNFSEGVSAADAAALLGIAEQDIVPEYPIRHAAVGPQFQLICVKNLQVLANCTVDPEGFARFNHGKGKAEGLFVFTSVGHSADADYSARMFFDANGPREDPATGSANCCFAAYLHDLFGGTFSAVVDQGVEMGRPSKIYLEVSEKIRVGGKVQQVMQGQLAQPFSNSPTDAPQ